MGIVNWELQLSSGPAGPGGWWTWNSDSIPNLAIVGYHKDKEGLTRQKWSHVGPVA